VTWLLEDPLPIWAGGAVAATVAGLIFVSRRSLAAMVGLAGVVLLTLLLVLVERLVVTDSEQVQASVAQIIGAVEANDLPGLRACIDPAAAKILADVDTIMPLVKLKDAGATSVRIEVDHSAQPLRATAQFRGRLDGVHLRSGQRFFYFDEVITQWVRQGDRWLLQDYTAQWKGRPVSPVDSLRGARPAPTKQ